MKKKTLVAWAALLILAFSASLALAANQPSGRQVQSAPAVVTPAPDIQTAPNMATPPLNYPPAPGSRYHRDARYYQGWGCGYYPANGSSRAHYGSWGCCNW